MVWCHKRGKPVLVSDMTTEQIKSSLRIIHRDYPWRSGFREPMERELETRAALSKKVKEGGV